MRLDPEKREIQELHSLIDLKNKKILEIGCGDGRITEMLNCKNNDILAIEPDQQQLKIARKKLPSVRFQVGTMSNLKTSKRFDLIVFSMSFHHVPLRSKKVVLQKAMSVLEADGKILLIEPDYNGDVTRIVMSLVTAERKRIEDANSLLKLLKIKKVKSVELNWYYNNFSELASFFEKVIGKAISSFGLDKIKKIVQINDGNKSCIVKDKINYFLISNSNGKRNSNGIF